MSEFYPGLWPAIVVHLLISMALEAHRTHRGAIKWTKGRRHENGIAGLGIFHINPKITPSSIVG